MRHDTCVTTTPVQRTNLCPADTCVMIRVPSQHLSIGQTLSSRYVRHDTCVTTALVHRTNLCPADTCVMIRVSSQHLSIGQTYIQQIRVSSQHPVQRTNLYPADTCIVLSTVHSLNNLGQELLMDCFKHLWQILRSERRSSLVLDGKLTTKNCGC